MLTLYILSLIFGGTLMAVSIFSGSHGGDMDQDVDAGGDLDHSLDMHSDIDHSLDVHTDATGALDAAHVDAGMDVHHDFPAHADVGHGGPPVQAGLEGQGVAEAVKFLTFRNFVFFTAFFGLTGTTLSLLSMPFLLTLFSAFGMGGFASFFGHSMMKYLKRTETGEAVDLKTLEGHQARVFVPVERNAKGRIVLEVKGQTHQLTALVDSESQKERFTVGENVLIVAFTNGIAYIIEADYIS